MSVRIRFKRVGRPRAPFYRLVAIDRARARDAEPIEILGTFAPGRMSKPEVLNVERVRYWVSVGAVPTDTVRQTLKRAGLWNQIKPAAGAPAKA